MTTFYGKRFSLNLIIVLVTIFGALCTASAKTTASIEAGWQSMQPIPARMLLLLPQEFAEFEYGYPHKGQEMRLPLGEQGVTQLKLLLQSAFTTMDVLPVASKAAAMDMLTNGSPQLRGYDLVAVPKFENVSYWDQGSEFGFKVDISLDVAPIRSRVMDTITGHSAAITPQGVLSPIERLTFAVSNALDAIKGVIESKREVWSAP